MFRMLHRVTGGEQTRHHGYARLLLGRPHLGVPSVCLQIVPRPGRVLSQEGVRRAPQGSCEARGRVALGQAIVPCFRAASRPYAVLPACRAVRWDECGAHVCSAPPACSEAMMLDRVGAAWVWPCVQLFWGCLRPVCLLCTGMGLRRRLPLQRCRAFAVNRPPLATCRSCKSG